MADTVPIPRIDLEGMIDDVDRAMDHAVASQTAAEPHWRLESFRDLLGELRNLKHALSDMVQEHEVPARVERIKPGGGRK